MKISEVINALEEIAPPHLQESYDNSGLIVGDANRQVKGILVCLDSIPEVIEEAVQKGCNLVVAHHPIVFSGLKKINGSNYVERAVIMAIKHDVAIYAIHTNLDNVLSSGVNGKIAARLGLHQCRPLRLHKSASGDPDIGAGVVGELLQSMSEAEFLSFLKERMATPLIRHTKLLGNEVRTVAVCGGSGSFLLEDAVAAGADVFVTGDYKYHQFFDADGRLVIADIGHYESEQFTIDLLCDLIQQNFPKFAPNSSEIASNPIIYYS